MDDSKEMKFSEWAILEIMGHRKVAGLVSEQFIAGAGFIRIDIPENENKMTTQFYSPTSMFSITPSTEEIARRFAKQVFTPPVSRYELSEHVRYESEEDEPEDFGV